MIILVPCESASLICPGFGGAFLFFQGTYFLLLRLFIHLSRRMEGALECFDSVLGAGSCRYTSYTICRKRKMKTTTSAKTKRMIRWRWMTCIAACGKYIFCLYHTSNNKTSPSNSLSKIMHNQARGLTS